MIVGSFGEAEVFSFHTKKLYNSSEGGTITTSNDELVARTRSMTKFGFQGNTNVVSLGINSKMIEAAAAVGLRSLDALDQFIKTSLRNYNIS